MPVFNEKHPMSTFHYHGGKVQASFSKKAFHVFVRDTDRVDKAIGWRDGKAAAWQRAIALIDAEL